MSWGLAFGHPSSSLFPQHSLRASCGCGSTGVKHSPALEGLRGKAIAAIAAPAALRRPGRAHSAASAPGGGRAAPAMDAGTCPDQVRSRCRQEPGQKRNTTVKVGKVGALHSLSGRQPLLESRVPPPPLRAIEALGRRRSVRMQV